MRTRAINTRREKSVNKFAAAECKAMGMQFISAVVTITVVMLCEAQVDTCINKKMRLVSAVKIFGVKFHDRDTEHNVRFCMTITRTSGVYMYICSVKRSQDHR